MKITSFVLSAMFVSGVFHSAIQQTLPERVRSRQGPLENIILRQFPPFDLPDLVKGSDLIARVVVLDDGRTQLTKDEESIYTDFTAQLLDIHFSSQPLAPSQKIVVRKPGGTMMIEGYSLTSRESDFPQFKRNEEFILFLKRDSSSGNYEVPHGGQGAFRNVAGFVEQVSKGGVLNRSGRGRVPISEFTQEIVRLINSG